MLQCSMKSFLRKLGPFSWTLHNMVAHPLSEIMHLCGLDKLSKWVHDATIPEHLPGEEGKK